MPFNVLSNKLTKRVGAESADSTSVKKNVNKAIKVKQPVAQDTLAGRVSYFTLRA
ncbi:hypothetical protein DM01DRAFT_1335390 [Hesseltinella vesiculosa]|uniref:Uncharacterized protein n=1 Tax=Hesseltinella vesiculosa TaxID=101127 RepID=A0A1X2GKJ3_9FUNG|nr:hypothetical protein DM01DRAFT_1335390 [Hesseltinella vesiculosa]